MFTRFLIFFFFIVFQFYGLKIDIIIDSMNKNSRNFVVTEFYPSSAKNAPLRLDPPPPRPAINRRTVMTQRAWGSDLVAFA